MINRISIVTDFIILNILIYNFFLLLRSHPLSSIAATGDNNDNVSSIRIGDIKDDLEAFSGNVKRNEMLNLAGKNNF